MSHNIKADGAAFETNGNRIDPTTTRGDGSALCSCGWASEEFQTRAARKTAHKAHQADVALDGPTPSPEPDIDETEAEYDGEDLMPYAEGGELPSVTMAKNHTDIAEPVRSSDDLPKPPTVSVVVPYTGAALHYFDAIVTRGTVALCKELLIELEVHPREKSVLVTAPSSFEATALAEALPMLWSAANGALKAWKKTDAVYRALNKSIPAQQEEASREERTFLTGWCRSDAAAAILGAARP